MCQPQNRRNTAQRCTCLGSPKVFSSFALQMPSSLSQHRMLESQKNSGEGGKWGSGILGLHLCSATDHLGSFIQTLRTIEVRPKLDSFDHFRSQVSVSRSLSHVATVSWTHNMNQMKCFTLGLYIWRKKFYLHYGKRKQKRSVLLKSSLKHFTVA